jgi:hypothetical protein
MIYSLHDFLIFHATDYGSTQTVEKAPKALRNSTLLILDMNSIGL